MGGPYAPTTVGSGPNDAAMIEPGGWLSDTVNSGVEYLMGLGGYDVHRRGRQGDGDATGAAPGDNSFYRDNASWMPGWGNTFGLDFLDPHGVPSGATAQDRATNYVGHPGHDPTGVWGLVRQNLVTNEGAAIGRAKAAGDTNIGFMDVYDAHVDAYRDAQTVSNAAHPGADQHNGFIDPFSFATAMYVAPLLEHAGINAGPITAASIDMFNDPSDTVGDGWAKRMGLAAGEIGGGAVLGLHGMGQMAQGNILQGGAEMLGGAGLAGLGVASGIWNTATAIGNGMGIGDAVSGIANVGGSVLSAGGTMLGDAARGIASWF
jgi:hypothetical protein